jgi:hypothetical protein
MPGEVSTGWAVPILSGSPSVKATLLVLLPLLLAGAEEQLALGGNFRGGQPGGGRPT